jgi:hypothetical protein
MDQFWPQKYTAELKKQEMKTSRFQKQKGLMLTVREDDLKFYSS